MCTIFGGPGWGWALMAVSTNDFVANGPWRILTRSSSSSLLRSWKRTKVLSSNSTNLKRRYYSLAIYLKAYIHMLCSNPEFNLLLFFINNSLSPARQPKLVPTTWLFLVTSLSIVLRAQKGRRDGPTCGTQWAGWRVPYSPCPVQSSFTTSHHLTITSQVR